MDFLITLQTDSKSEYYCDMQKTGPAGCSQGTMWSMEYSEIWC